MSIDKKPFQEVYIPEGIEVTNNTFYAYDPVTKFSAALSEYYLSEDLFEASYEEGDIIVDLGWYGNLSTNEGKFKLFIIRNSDWDNPLITLESKSLSEITNMLEKTLEHVALGQFSA